ncbi:MAG: hypothetical protein GY801_52025 [bacterium]|nr:hypothetical protein [bacterium]
MRKDDLFHKILLSIIALSLVVIALTSIFRSEPIEAQSRVNFEKVKFAYTNGGFLLMDSSTGDIWMYSFGRQQPDFIGRLQKAGGPMLMR